MKTPREADPAHNPTTFTARYGANRADKKEGEIRAVLDLSSDGYVAPCYDPRGLEEGGVAYHRFATAAKVPPSRSDVVAFAHLVNQLRASYGINGEAGLLGVHCHYGYNRTGFLICTYLVEHEGFPVKEAVALFAEKRPPGIQHAHFLDELWVRYGVSLMEGGG